MSGSINERRTRKHDPDGGVAIDMIRCAKLAKDRGLGGPIHPASAYFCKHPPEQMTDDSAYEALERVIRG